MSDNVSFAGQIHPEQMQEVANKGFKTVINNRPDGEDVGQPTSSENQAAAQKAGLAYKAIQFAGGQLTQEQVKEFAEFYNQADKPVLMFCRTGNRSNMLYQAAVQMDLLDD